MIKKIFSLSFILLTFIFVNHAIFANPSAPIPKIAQQKIKKQAAVVSQHELATNAGIEVLKNGGNAADAAIAVAFTLSVVEPEGSGIGGGGFLLYYQKKTNTFSFVDYREVAPVLAKNEMYLANKKLARKGPLAIAVPGFVKGMDEIYKKFGGKVSWEKLLEHPLKHARQGFIMSDSLIERTEMMEKSFKDFKIFQDTFVKVAKNDKPFLKQEALANTIELIQKNGGTEFYTGTLSQKIIEELNNLGSPISADDLKNYQVRFLAPKYFEFAGYQFYTAPLPSTGGLLIEQLLRSAKKSKINSESEDLAKFMELELIKYFENRKSLSDIPGKPFGSTSHLSVVDEEGNIAVMTNSINFPYGSGVILTQTGLVMNNHMDDFHFDKKENAKNRINNSNRPLSSMAPTLIFHNKKPHLSIGTPGGLSIPMNIYQVLQAHLLDKKSLTEAIAQPKFYSFPHLKKAFYETGFNYKRDLNGMLFEPKRSHHLRGNIQAISFGEEGLKTFSDPRFEGTGEIIENQ